MMKMTTICSKFERLRNYVMQKGTFIISKALMNNQSINTYQDWIVFRLTPDYVRFPVDRYIH